MNITKCENVMYGKHNGYHIQVRISMHPSSISIIKINMREDDVLVIIFFVCIPVSLHESSDVALNHSSSCTKMINRYWGGWQYLQKYSKHNGQFLWEFFICSFEKPGQLLWKLLWSTVSYKMIILFFILGNDVMILNTRVFNFNLKHDV